jgi:hypothetical protein
MLDFFSSRKKQAHEEKYEVPKAEDLPAITTIPNITSGIDPQVSKFTENDEKNPSESTTDPSSPPPPILSRARRISLVALATCAICMATGSSTSLNVALPTIQTDLDMTATNLQWVSSAFTLANGCLLLLSGRLADIRGRKRVFVIGMSWQAIWSLIGGFMKSGSGLIVARAMAGAGAAMR